MSGGRWGPFWDKLVFSKVRERVGGQVKYMTSGAPAQLHLGRGLIGVSWSLARVEPCVGAAAVRSARAAL